MIKHAVVFKPLIRFIAIFLIVVISAGPLYAQVGRYRRFSKPLTESGGNSFRQNDINSEMDEMQLQGAGEDILNRGSMMNMPSSSGLLYQVHILGEVENPGTYRIMASERLSEVLNRAGGLADQGSRRRIEIRRDGVTVKRVDLLQFQQYGKLNHNPYLLDNDVVYVPLKSNTVQIVGAVKRPETYELGGEKTAWSVINLAGGYSSGIAKNEPIRVIRFVDGSKEVLEISNDPSELKRTGIHNGDVVFVPNVITAGHKFDYDLAKLPGDNVFYPSYEDRVFVLGGVSMPGAYPFNPYYNIHQYISLAGGYTKLSTRKIKVLTPEGKHISVNKKNGIKINPGDTILIGERRIPPEGWVNIFMGIAGFGLSTTATVLSLTR